MSSIYDEDDFDAPEPVKKEPVVKKKKPNKKKKAPSKKDTSVKKTTSTSKKKKSVNKKKKPTAKAKTTTKPAKKIIVETKTKPKPKSKKKKTKIIKEPKVSLEEFFSSIQPKPEGLKHLIECKCFLPQFKNWDDPPVHKFVVFSEIDEEGKIMKHYAQCNNCGIVHKVTEVGNSEFLKKETMLSLEDVEDIKPILPDWLVGILEKHMCDLATWQEARFIYQNKLWGRFTSIARERDGDTITGKALVILGENLHKIEIFDITEMI